MRLVKSVCFVFRPWLLLCAQSHGNQGFSESINLDQRLKGKNHDKYRLKQ